MEVQVKRKEYIKKKRETKETNIQRIIREVHKYLFLIQTNKK